MNNRKTSKASWQQLALATNSNQLPPGGVARGAAATPPGKPTLTQKFNAAAQNTSQSDKVVSKPASKQQIDALQKKMSQPRPSLDFGTRGSVNNARNPAADRKLVKTMETMKKTLAANKGLKQEFTKAQKKGQLTQSFNRSSNGRSM